MLKIGILIKDFEKLSNWELRIIKGIIDDPKLDLSLLIKDGRTGNEIPTSKKSKVFRLLRSKNILGKIIFTLQTKIERKLFPNKTTIDKTEIITYLQKVPCIQLSPKRKGFLDIFSREDGEKVKNYGLDIILRHEFNIIRGGILESSKYGIWSFHHGDNSINRGGPAGFWEIALKQPSVGVTLQRLTPELDGGLVIDKAYFNKTWSFVRTNNEILEASVSLLFKNIQHLKNGKFAPIKSTTYYNPLYRSPDLKNSIRYLWSFYWNLSKKVIKKVEAKLLNRRYNCWTLFIGKGDFMNATLFRLKPLELPKNEFWADPFLFKYKDCHYVFFENYSYKTKKGKLSCGRLENKKLIDVCDVLDLDYHLSYPFIFEEDGEIFLMPETSENRRLEIYKCVQFPNKWELYSTAFEGEMVYDAHLYNDENKQKWLFINKSIETTSPSNELHIYRVDSLKMEKIEGHLQNPVIINSKLARNGGAIFKHDNELYRPSQYNADGIYGRGLNINKIKKLSIDEYVEEKTIRIMPNFHKGLISTHHLHQVDGLFVMDAAFRKK